MESPLSFSAALKNNVTLFRYFSFIAILLSLSCFPAFAAPKGNNSTEASPAATFSWQEGKKLCWQDFRGKVPENESSVVAAITACGIGYYTNSVSARERPRITVYNSFYMHDSWVRAGDADERVLRHEQGHFDLCEIYTRKLRERVANANITGANMQRELERIYNQINREYEARQLAYEEETSHGTNAKGQQQWLNIIATELQGSYSWASR